MKAKYDLCGECHSAGCMWSLWAKECTHVKAPVHVRVCASSIAPRSRLCCVWTWAGWVSRPHRWIEDGRRLEEAAVGGRPEPCQKSSFCGICVLLRSSQNAVPWHKWQSRQAGSCFLCRGRLGGTLSAFETLYFLSVSNPSISLGVCFVTALFVRVLLYFHMHSHLQMIR